MGVDYTTVTEVPGSKVTREQLSRTYTRYRFAAEFCEGKDVLEVACGPGLGLGYLAAGARKVVGGDYMENFLKLAKKHYNGQIGILRLDAQALPFRDSSFDVVIMYEAIYYLAEPEEFVRECLRVLRDNGVIIVCTVNKDWDDFNPSPFSKKYFSIPELFELLDQHGLEVEFFGECPVHTDSVSDKIISAIKRTAVTCHLMPKTMKGKEFLKRLIFGRLQTLEEEIKDGVVEYSPPVQISSEYPNSQYKILYAVARIP